MRPLKLGVVVLLLLNLTGCWSKVELDELTFVYGLFIDAGKEPGSVEVTINSPLPNRISSAGQPAAGGGNGATFSTVSKTANTISDAVMLIQKDLTRKLNLTHLMVIVIGQPYAKQGIGDLLEWIKGEPAIPLGTFIMGSPGSAKELNKLTPFYEQLPAQVLMNFATEKFMFATTIKDCLFADAAGVGFSINHLSFGEKEDRIEEDKPEYWAGIQGAMLFHKDTMKGTLKLKEGRALAWATERVRYAAYSVSWDEGRSNASAVFVSTKSSKDITRTNKGPVFTVKLKGKASITYLKDAQNRSKEELSKIITEKLSEKLTANLTDAIRSSQKVGADILQLGLLLEWNDPKVWKQLNEQWEDYYTNKAEIKVTTDFRIVDFGTAKK